MLKVRRGRLDFLRAVGHMGNEAEAWHFTLGQCGGWAGGETGSSHSCPGEGRCCRRGRWIPGTMRRQIGRSCWCGERGEGGEARMMTEFPLRRGLSLEWGAAKGSGLGWEILNSV